MKTMFVTAKEITRMCDASVVFDAAYTQSMFQQEWTSFRDNIRNVLSRKWKERWLGEGDFLVADDFSYNWLVTGGLYTPRIVSWKFVDLVHKAISACGLQKWRVHFVIELYMGTGDFSIPSGELLLHNGVIYFPSDDKFPYDKYFIKRNWLNKWF